MKGISEKLGVVIMLIVMMGLLSGCVDNTTVVEVKKDGSGTVTEVTYVSPAMDQMMNQMMQGMMAAMSNAAPGEGGKVEVSVKKHGNAKMLDRKQYEAKALQMGEGVSVLNVTEVKRKDGADGVRVDYAFKDITKVKIEEGSSPDPMSGMSGAGMDPEKPAKKSKAMTFAFTPGSPAKLIITMPPDEKAPPAGAADPGEMMETNEVVPKNWTGV